MPGNKKFGFKNLNGNLFTRGVVKGTARDTNRDGVGDTKIVEQLLRMSVAFADKALQATKNMATSGKISTVELGMKTAKMEHRRAGLADMLDGVKMVNIFNATTIADWRVLTMR